MDPEPAEGEWHWVRSETGGDRTREFCYACTAGYEEECELAQEEEEERRRFEAYDLDYCEWAREVRVTRALERAMSEAYYRPGGLGAIKAHLRWASARS